MDKRINKLLSGLENIVQLIIDYICGYKILEKIISDFNEVKEYYNNIGISASLIIVCSILNAKGFTIPTREWYNILGKIDRDILLIDNLYIENFDDKIKKILKPIFDSIYNTCGYERCIAYDKNDNFVGLN